VVARKLPRPDPYPQIFKGGNKNSYGFSAEGHQFEILVDELNFNLLKSIPHSNYLLYFSNKKNPMINS
jgi:hypothetical protein